MSASNKTIKAALKKILVPHMSAEGFKGKYPEFVRKEAGEVVPESALTTAHAPFDTRARLREKGGRQPAGELVSFRGYE